MKKAIIIDLDNCLFDSRELIKNHFPTDEKSREQWDIYHSHYGVCTPNQWCVQLVKKFASDHEILFITSREARGNAIKDTINCLEEALNTNRLYNTQISGNIIVQDKTPLVKYQLIMRTEEDYRASVDVKRDLYNSVVKDRYDVILAIDDEVGNIDLWRELGIPALQCYFGDKN